MVSDYPKFIYNAWKNFTETGVLVPGVKQEIGESWQRCRKNSVDYNNGRGNDRFKVPVEAKIQENIQLVAVAHSIMENIYGIVEGSGFSLFLSDKDGYIIDVIGDERIMDKAEKLNFVKGALWTEEAVGTNAIGTAIFLNKPVQTIGAEHYGKHQHSWTCSAAPIHDEEGNLIGCINMSGDYNEAHIHTLGIVISAAQYIQKQLALSVSYNLLNITFDSVTEGMIVLDENLNIKRINDRACSILGISIGEALKTDIRKLVKNINFNDLMNSEGKSYNNLELDFHIKNNIIKCIINAVPMQAGNKSVGIVITFREAQYVHRLVNKMVGYKASYKFGDFITENNRMKDIIKYAEKAAKSDCNILIEGESGTGKEVIAQSIHNSSKRYFGPFVAVNCASIPRELVESELFGYDRGAFTGASKEGHPGKFELADGGTIFLDEIGELPLDIQSKLLRVLDNNRISRVGGTYEKQLDVRVICATNRDLKEEIKNRSFREDLFYRLNVVNIKTIPLRDRKDDIEAITYNFISKLNLKNENKEKRLNSDYINHLKAYEWPGNVRELRNVVERDYYLSESVDILSPTQLEKSILLNSEEAEEQGVITMQVLERENIEKALQCCKGNIVAAAKQLNISRATMYRKIKKYNINNV